MTRPSKAAERAAERERKALRGSSAVERARATLDALRGSSPASLGDRQTSSTPATPARKRGVQLSLEPVAVAGYTRKSPRPLWAWPGWKPRTVQVRVYSRRPRTDRGVPKTCGSCGEKGHNRRGCPKPSPTK